MKRVLVVVGTRPEAIKLAPVVRALDQAAGLQAIVCETGQHTTMLAQACEAVGLRTDCGFTALRDDQTLAHLTGRLLAGLDGVMATADPLDLVLVQGDTTTALAGALVGFYRGVPVGHVEAGLRSPVADRPFPEEMNRRLIGQLARLHFAPTPRAAARLRAEGVPGRVWLTGNPIVDVLREHVARPIPEEAARILARAAGARLVLVTCHRREAWGPPLEALAAGLGRLAARRRDLRVVWPVHANPRVRGEAERRLAGVEGIALLPPLPYPTFVALLARAAVVVTDSGGVIEEAATLGRRLVIIRDETERPEVLDAGRAVLLPTSRLSGLPETVEHVLAEVPELGWWDGFGDGQAGWRIALAVRRFLHPALEP